MILVARDQEASYNVQPCVLTSVDVAGFSKVFGSMWGGSLYGRFEASAVFMVILSLCDREGVVDMTPEAIAGRTGWPLELIKRGLVELEATDPRSRTPDHDGRRLLRLDEHRDWGWRITNYQKYRDEMRSQERREYLRIAKQKERAKKKRAVDSQQVNHFQPIAEAEAEAEKTNTSGFALFWSQWPSGPRKTAKRQCEAKWVSQGCDLMSVQVALNYLKSSDQWKKDGGAFIPAPLTWLNRRGWEFEIPKPATNGDLEASNAWLEKHAADKLASQTPQAKAARDLALKAIRRAP